jgi:hypothetical protein
MQLMRNFLRAADTKHLFGLATATTLLAVPIPAHSQLFQVTNVQFSASVSNDGNYTVVGPAVNGTISRSTLRQGRLFFSFAIIGLQPAVNYLQQNGFLESLTQKPMRGQGA